MRLIDTASYEIQEFHGSNIPQYAILSHRWEKDEINLFELGDKVNEHKDGWNKVRRFCRYALNAGYCRVWIDTCCIDKSSSADLSEAINSMYEYYSNAQTCYAYLCDVRDEDLVNRKQRDDALRASQWFARGWTLQELLAPRKVVFVTSTWTKEIGDKQSLSSVIHSITGIPEFQVRHYYGATTVKRNYANASSVAEIMAWASRRKTTRREDEAYSLMGLFGINMPLLYGEGRNAFLRLQLEILKVSDDETIFVHYDYSRYGLLAGSVSAFQFAIGMGLTPSPWDDARPEYAMTNKGLRIEPLLMHTKDLTSEAVGSDCIMPLNCRRDGSQETRAVLCLADASKEGASSPSSPTANTAANSSGTMRRLSKTTVVFEKENAEWLRKRMYKRELVYINPESGFWQ